MATSLVSTGVQFPDSTIQTTAASSAALNTQIFTASGTWTKPASGTYVFVRLWGGGGGGGKGATSSLGPLGGSGGAFFCTTLLMSDMPSTVPVTVGAGGVGRSTAGNAEVVGGASWFGTRIPVTSMVVNTNYVIADPAFASTSPAVWAGLTRGYAYNLDGDSTGGVFNCRAVGTGTGQVANPKIYAQASLWSASPSQGCIYYGQFPYIGDVTEFVIPQYDRITTTSIAAQVQILSNVCQPNFFYKPANSFMFPAYSSSLPYANWTSIFAGAGGGGYLLSVAINDGIPGNTIYGGAGGAGGTTVSGTNGTAPGGGGGATNTGTKGGDGAAGRVEVYVY